MPDFSAQTLRPFVSSTTFERAQGLLLQGKVLECITEADGLQWELDGLVQGSSGFPYEVIVSLVLDGDGGLDHFDSDCNCPVRFECKHGVALALHALQRGAADTGLPFESSDTGPGHVRQWLFQLDLLQTQAGGGGAQDVLADKGQVVYLLRAQARRGEAPMLRLSWHISKKNKRGDWNKPRKPGYLDQHKIISASRMVPSQDADCVRLISGLGGNSYQNPESAAIEGEMGLLLLEKCAATGRLFWDAGQGRVSGPPLAWGPAHSLQWDWLAVKSATGAGGRQGPCWQLQSRVPGKPEALIFSGPPAVYVLPDEGCCGAVQLPAGISPGQLPLLLAAPPLPEQVFSAGSALLQRLAPLKSLPPGVQAPVAWPLCVPDPVLMIRRTMPEERAQCGAVLAQLGFDYGGLRGWWAGQAAVVRHDHDGTPVLLTRNLADEDTAQQRLQQLGLFGDQRGIYLSDQDSVWLNWAAQGWQPLRDAGFTLELGPGLDDLVQTIDAVAVSMQHDEAEYGDGGSPWFDLSLGIEINGLRHNILPWLPRWLEQVEMDPAGAQLPQWLWKEQADGRWLRLPSTALSPWLNVLLELVGDRKMDSENLRLSRVEALRLAAETSLLGAGVVWEGAGQLRSMLGQLNGEGALPDVPVPPGLQAQLRPYQQQGLNWLQFLRQHQLGGVLADDMGLGKTLQTLAHFLVEKEAGRLDCPCLVVAPVSLLGNWRREAQRFAPGLRARVWHGLARHEGGFAEDCDLLIAPYSLLQRDRERWLAQRWHVLVLDEAQHIKNASSQAATVVREINARQRLALSGTPLENHLGEVWSLFHFLMPGFLGSQARFQQLFRTPVEKQGDVNALARLRQRVTPFMLRRTKAAVASELPDCVETIVTVQLAGAQADLYETIRLTTEKTVRDVLADKGLARSRIQLLDALLKLRQACCDPRLVKNNSLASKVKTSAKLEQLMAMLEELLAEGRKVLLFSQFTSMLTLIEAELQRRDIPWSKLTGQTQKRDDAIERFTGGQVALFLISLKAGGTGLNLPQADTVIHYDPWWNPAVEAQATGRAHRIGQTRQVMVYKLVAEGTIEERILALQERKAALAEGLLTGPAGRDQPLFTEADVAELFKPLGA